MIPALSPALKPHVLVADDDARLRELLRQYLSEHGYVVSTATAAPMARGAFKSMDFDVLVLDVMMPGESGLDLTRFYRASPEAREKGVPILLLTAKGEPEERIEGLEAGADDYLVKPFEPKELLLRLNALLRRAAPESAAPALVRLGRWTYDSQRDELRSEAETLRLTGMEAKLMKALAAEPGVVMSREMLAGRADGGAVNDRTIDVQVTRLRRKIEEDPRNPRYLVTMRGEGYMFMPDAEG